MKDDSDWQGEDDTSKRKKQEAANQFLQATLDSAELRAAVLGNEATAHDEFKECCKKAKIELPDYVRIICVDDERVARNKLIVFALPHSSTKVADGELWRDGWLAAWDPY